MACRFVSTFALIALVQLCCTSPLYSQKDFTLRTVAANLEIPWEIEWGPDGFLWVTERRGIFYRINPETGERRILLDVRDSTYVQRESGLYGFAFHPQFPQVPYLYVTYAVGITWSEYKVIRRYEYVEDTLIDPVEIIRIRPSGDYHQGGRLAIGADGMLYTTNGDSYFDDTALDDNSLAGKVLRMNLDGSIPADNPIPGSYLWTKGHRNPQGLVVLPNGQIWISEHGNNIEDELNLIIKGRNYGWPRVEGVCDEDFEISYCDSNNVIEPEWSTGQVTFATAGLEFYDSDRYPVFKNSLLLATLKNSALLQLRFNDNTDSIVEDLSYFHRSLGRIRDIAVSPDGRIFLSSSNREINALYPFPELDDDKIVEVIPVADTSTPIYSAPDTLFVRARPGDEILFRAPISNIGSAPFRMEWIGDVDTNSFLRSAQWRVPITLLPGKTYGIDIIFNPPVEGDYRARTQISTAELGNYQMILKGSTRVGVLRATSDTMLVKVELGSSTIVDVPFVNTGTDTISVYGAVLEGEGCPGVEVIAVDTGVVDPGDTARVTIRFNTPPVATSQCIVLLESTSYSIASTTLLVTTEPSSVAEQFGKSDIFSYPNPFSDHVTVIIPSNMVGADITIYNSVGEVVDELHTDKRQYFTWNPGSNASVTNGIYLLVISSNSKTATHVVQFIGR